MISFEFTQLVMKWICQIKSMHWFNLWNQIKTFNSLVMLGGVKMNHFDLVIQQKDGMHHFIVVQLLTTQNTEPYFYWISTSYQSGHTQHKSHH